MLPLIFQNFLPHLHFIQLFPQPSILLLNLLHDDRWWSLGRYTTVSPFVDEHIGIFGRFYLVLVIARFIELGFLVRSGGFRLHQLIVTDIPDVIVFVICFANEMAMIRLGAIISFITPSPTDQTHACPLMRYNSP